MQFSVLALPAGIGCDRGGGDLNAYIPMFRDLAAAHHVTILLNQKVCADARWCDKVGQRPTPELDRSVLEAIMASNAKIRRAEGAVPELPQFLPFPKRGNLPKLKSFPQPSMAKGTGSAGQAAAA